MTDRKSTRKTPEPEPATAAAEPKEARRPAASRAKLTAQPRATRAPAKKPEPAPAAEPPLAAMPAEGRVRAVIENITPSVDHGRFAVKRIAGDEVFVEADCYADGHDQIACMLMWRRAESEQWERTPMRALGNDRWRGEFTVGGPGSYRYTVAAWVDHFLSWRHDLGRRVDPEDVSIAARVGTVLLREAAERAAAQGAPAAKDRDALLEHAQRLDDAQSPEEIRRIGLDDSLLMLAQRYPDRRYEFVYPVEFPLTVDRLRARFSSWYEMFPRSAGEEGKHGTFRDCEARLPYIAQMGFDILYLPPIHPIGRERRKGRNNTLLATPDDVGSPWAIGAAEGGHTAIHPALGTLNDFRELVTAARSYGMEVALDIAFQTAPDHPYVGEHPQWFRRRPDGSVQYAENPPKKYQDIYPFDFESEDWPGLWCGLAAVFEFWIAQGVHVFRVDNPHTKAFAFWEWVIARLKSQHPELIFLSEAFTRPKVMHRLAKLGFTQSYTYFTWRNTKWELTEYFNELAHGPGREYFRPNAWPNTPDILPEHLQFGGRAAFMQRLVLAATLSANYGIYGPAFELMEHDPREPGSEEYLHSEKYELKRWNIDHPESLASFIARVNRARHDNPALQSNDGLSFQSIDNDQLLCYAKVDTDVEPDDPSRNVVIVAVNLDVHYRQSGWVNLDLAALGLDPNVPFQVHDLLTDARYLWHGSRNYVELDPNRVPAHIFRVRRRGKSETDFDYFE